MRRTVLMVIAASGQPGGPCAYACTLTCRDRRRDITGGSVESTHARQLWRGLIHALNALSEPCVVLCYSNAEWLVRLMTDQPAESFTSNDLYTEARAAALEHRLEMHYRQDVRTQRDLARRACLDSATLGAADMPVHEGDQLVTDQQLELL